MDTSFLSVLSTELLHCAPSPVCTARGEAAYNMWLGAAPQETHCTNRKSHRDRWPFRLFFSPDVFLSAPSLPVVLSWQQTLPQGDSSCCFYSRQRVRISDECQREAAEGEEDGLMCCSCKSQVTAGWHTLWCTDTIHSHRATVTWIIYSTCSVVKDLIDGSSEEQNTSKMIYSVNMWCCTEIWASYICNLCGPVSTCNTSTVTPVRTTKSTGKHCVTFNQVQTIGNLFYYCVNNIPEHYWQVI